MSSDTASHEDESTKDKEPSAFFKAEFDIEQGAERVAQVLIDAVEEVEKIERDIEKHLKGKED